MIQARLPVLLALCLGASVLAAEAQTAVDPAAPASFQAHKQQELAKIAARLQAMQTLQSCVQAAQDHAAVRACHEAARASMPRGR